MIVTIVCDILGVENNGVAVAMMNLIRYLRAEEHTVRILCADQAMKGQPNYYVVPTQSFGKALDKFVSHVGVSLAKADKDVIVEALKGTEHVHIMVPLGLGLATAKIAHEMDLPITAGFHMQAENLTCYFKMHKIRPINTFVYKFIYRHLYRYCDGVHYPTKFIRDTFEGRIKKTTSGYVISNGVNAHICKKEVDKPPEYNGEFLIMTTGRYSVEKAQDTLIKAVKYSRHKDNIRLILAGQGIKDKKYHKLAKKLPLPPVFKFFERSEIVDALNYCDMYVHPAVYELEGIACLEAIACGKMTIVSDSKLSATREFAIDDKCVFRHKKPKDLARVIDFWIEHPDLRKEYEQKYLENAVIYRQDECMKRMVDMIEDVDKKHAHKEA